MRSGTLGPRSRTSPASRASIIAITAVSESQGDALSMPTGRTASASRATGESQPSVKRTIDAPWAAASMAKACVAGW
jgi:hypothetical protein